MVSEYEECLLFFVVMLPMQAIKVQLPANLESLSAMQTTSPQTQRRRRTDEL